MVLADDSPNFFLKAEFADGRECIWLFDAKYRLYSGPEEAEAQADSDDLVPDDALHQMHRYRDSLIHEQADQDSGYRTKARAVMAAFALYPGYFKQVTDRNPYEELIEEVGNRGFQPLAER
ncbi:MAG: nuclease domain-containing protein [Granulosicoccus sp.]